MALLHTPVCDLLGCRYPVVLAGMGGVARSELVTAVTEAGGFGFLGMVREQPDLIRSEVARVRERTGRDFGVNLIPAATPPSLLAAEVEACLDLKVPVVCLFWDLAAPLVTRFRQAGVVVLCQIGSTAEAVAAEAAGAHAVIAQGGEAGGHVRGTVPLLSLLAAVKNAVTIPVLAAGGIVSGRDFATVLNAQADGAVLGTAFLATTESFAHDYHKNRIVAAKAGETVRTADFHINWPRGAFVRVLANSVTRGEHGDPYAQAKTVIGDDDGRPIYLFSTDSPLRSTTGNFEAMALYAGEGAGAIASVTTAGERLRTIVSDAEATLNRAAKSNEAASDAGFHSPACMARDANAAYMGYLGRDDLLAFLNEMLEAERAGARVTLRTAMEARGDTVKAMARTVHRDEARWCAMLLQQIERLDGLPSGETGAFYNKAMAITDIGARFAFLNRGQGWVVRKLRDVLPKIRDDQLYRELKAMLASHEDNIAMVDSSGLVE